MEQECEDERERNGKEETNVPESDHLLVLQIDEAKSTDGNMICGHHSDETMIRCFNKVKKGRQV